MCLPTGPRRRRRRPHGAQDARAASRRVERACLRRGHRVAPPGPVRASDGTGGSRTRRDAVFAARGDRLRPRCRRDGSNGRHGRGDRRRRRRRSGRRTRLGWRLDRRRPGDRRLRHRLQRGRFRRRRGRRRRRWYAYRQQAQRVDVAVGVGGEADAEVDVRQERDRVRALADGADDLSLGDDAAACDGGRAELEQRHRVDVGQDRDRPAAAGYRADERDGAGDRRAHGVADGRADVDAAVLSACVRIGAERKLPQDRAVDRPRPAPRDRGGDERHEDGQGNQEPAGRGREEREQPKPRMCHR